jgi:hypothetical protein
MIKPILIVGLVAAASPVIARAQDAADNVSDVCSKTSLDEMQSQLSTISDSETRRRAEIQLVMSRVAMENDDTKNCARHMHAAKEVLDD